MDKENPNLHYDGKNQICEVKEDLENIAFSDQNIDQKEEKSTGEKLKDISQSEIADKVRDLEKDGGSTWNIGKQDVEYGGLFRSMYTYKKVNETSKERLHFDDSKINIEKDLAPGTTLDIDFHGNGRAEQTVGAGDILPPEIQIVVIIDDKGNERAGERKSSGVRKVGYYDAEGYIPIYTDYKIYIPTDQEIQTKYAPLLAEKEDGEKKGDEAKKWTSAYWKGDAESLKTIKEEEKKNKADYWDRMDKYDAVSFTPDGRPEFKEYVKHIWNIDLSDDQMWAKTPSKAEYKNIFNDYCRKLGLDELDFEVLYPLIHALAEGEMDKGLKYQSIGPSTGHGFALGKYQFMPESWEGMCKQVFGQLEAPTPISQETVAFVQVAMCYSRYKKKGKSLEEIVPFIGPFWYAGRENYQSTDQISQKKAVIYVKGKKVEVASPKDYSNSLVRHYEAAKKRLQNTNNID